MSASDFPVGTKVRFTPGPFATSPVEAVVTGHAPSGFLVTKDDAGKERKARPGTCTKI